MPFLTHSFGLITTSITAYQEKILILKASANTKLKYLNTQLLGLSGRHHPSLLGIKSTQDVKKLRIHLKFLTGDFLCGERRALDTPGSDPKCLLCLVPVESLEHILVSCRATAEVRHRLYPELLNTVLQVQPNCSILHGCSMSQLTQFLLDCTSINLQDTLRIPSHNPEKFSRYHVTGAML